MEKYLYYIKGTSIGILEFDESDELYKSPLSDESNMVLIEYTVDPFTVTDYDSELDISRALESAIIYYMRYRMLEVSDPNNAEYFKRKFYEQVGKEYERKHGASTVRPRSITKL